MTSENHLPHLHLAGPTDCVPFTMLQQRGADKLVPPRQRQTHGAFIKKQLEIAWREAESEFIASHSDRNGVNLEFRSAPGFELAIKSLEDMRSKKIRLCNVRKEIVMVINREDGAEVKKEVTFATVFVANDKRSYFFKKIEEYLNDQLESGEPKNADLINSIDGLRKALLIDSFWQDDKALIPGEKASWCEIWLRDSQGVLERFNRLLKQYGIVSKPGCIRFPERIVKLVHVSRLQRENISKSCDYVAEYRSAKDTSSFWVGLPTQEQAAWVENLTERLLVDKASLVSVCILDTGINYGHPLLSPVLDSTDCHSVDPTWGTEDHQGHGTLMAGLAAYGDLKRHLEEASTVKIKHVLECLHAV